MTVFLIFAIVFLGMCITADVKDLARHGQE